MLNQQSYSQTRRNELQRSLGYNFRNPQLLTQSLTRRSAINSGIQEQSKGHNESLEFLGDRVLNLVIADILRVQHQEWDEGQLSIAHAKLIQNFTLAGIAKKLNLGEHIVMDSGERVNNFGQQNKKILADTLEAIIGAIYLDTARNLKSVGKFIHKHWYALHPVLFELIKDLSIRNGRTYQQKSDAIIESIKLGADIRRGNTSGLTIFHLYELDAEFIEVILREEKDWSGIDLRGVDKDAFRGYEYATDDIYYKSLDFEDLNFKDANLSGVDLSSRVMKNVDFSNACLARTDFSHVNFKSVKFKGANLSGANFKFCTMDFVSLESYSEVVRESHSQSVFKINVDPDEFWQAVNRNNIKIVKEFLENKYKLASYIQEFTGDLRNPAVVIKDDTGLTALHISAGKGYEEMTQLLLKSGANPKEKVRRHEWVDPREIFSDGYMRNMRQERMKIGSMPIIDKTPLDLARGNEHKSIELILLNHMGLIESPIPPQKLERRSTTSSMTQTTDNWADKRDEVLSRYGNASERQQQPVKNEQSGWCNLL